MYLISNHQLINSNEIICKFYLVGPDPNRLTIASISLGFKSLYQAIYKTIQTILMARSNNNGKSSVNIAFYTVVIS